MWSERAMKRIEGSRKRGNRILGVMCESGLR